MVAEVGGSDAPLELAVAANDFELGWQLWVLHRTSAGLSNGDPAANGLAGATLCPGKGWCVPSGGGSEVWYKARRPRMLP